MSKITDKNKIKVEGHRGTWSVIEEVHAYRQTFYLLEHNTYGEDANLIAIDDTGKLILEDITDGIGEVLDHLNDNIQMYYKD